MTFREYFDKEAELINKIDPAVINSIYADLFLSIMWNGRVFLCGNGGSFLTCQHFAEDASKGLKVHHGINHPFIVLGSNPGMTMAIANDLSYEDIFSFELETHKPESRDVLIGLSVSGNSKNVIKAFKLAQQYEFPTIALVGKNGTGELAKFANDLLAIDSDHFGIVEDIHSAVLHHIAYRFMDTKPKET